jgi:hypothetical protein
MWFLPRRSSLVREVLPSPGPTGQGARKVCSAELEPCKGVLPGRIHQYSFSGSYGISPAWTRALYQGFPVKPRCVDELQAALFGESRTHDRCRQCEAGNPGFPRTSIALSLISLLLSHRKHGNIPMVKQ